MSSKKIIVSITLGTKNYPVGWLWCHNRKGREAASFEYCDNWLQNAEHFALEPALMLTPGTFHTLADQNLFGSIGDSAPDRWGRVLMRRAEAQRARLAGESARTLGEVDFLLGVHDEARQGALRFSYVPEGPFLSDDRKKSIPPLIELPKLLTATKRFLDNEENAEDLKILLAPGSSLGGARPKASVRDTDGQLCIAKFPSRDDEFNVVVWENITLILAKKAGLTIPSSMFQTIIDSPVLVVRRFDRKGEARIPFLSAMSMLGAKDNELHSYLEIADALCQYGAEPSADLAELWRRVVFNILISNTDDHLRNHGFIYERRKGWKLSPAYDMNPVPVEIKPRILSTAIDLNDNTASLDLALSVAKDFRLSQDNARKIVKEVSQAVRLWQETARSFDLPKHEIDRMASAFEHGDAEKAKSM